MAENAESVRGCVSGAAIEAALWLWGRQGWEETQKQGRRDRWSLALQGQRLGWLSVAKHAEIDVCKAISAASEAALRT